MMNTKMKGLLKGLRYISQIFEAKEEEEEEMQIGFPTDVKHVAHIGWDGPSVTPPSWMNEFRSAPLSSLGAEAMGDLTPTKFPSQDLSHNARVVLSPSIPDPLDSQPEPQSNRNRSTSESPTRHLSELPLPKPSRRHSSTGSASESSSGVPRHSRRNKSTEAVPSDSLDGSSRHSRRQNRVKEQETGSESPGQALPSIPKQARRKKKTSKGSSGEDSLRVSRNKAVAGYSDPGSDEPAQESDPAMKPIGEDERQ